MSRAIARSVLWTALFFASVACSEAAPASTQHLGILRIAGR